ncbi:hypothetical protein [Maribacter sp. R77961]|uniref:hypothetical protein n=1 Tax=Maribacter sp. R77961 TaxID=3093871 RepID=UPI0037CB397C
MSGLTTDQLSDIKGYLDAKELFHLDLRNEIIDHISEGISAGMMHQQLSFEDAFTIEKQKWHDDLQSHSSYWLGLLWMGPKIVIQKCVKHTKILYLKAALPALAALLFFYSTENLWKEQILIILNSLVGIVYIGLFLLLLILKYKIKQTGYQTSFSFLYKINAISFSFLLVLYNPILSNIFSFIKEGSISYVALFIHAFTHAFSWFFVQFYKAHSQIQKIKMA